jgi:hypothetical protein
MEKAPTEIFGGHSEIEIESDGVVATGRRTEKWTVRSSAELN